MKAISAWNDHLAQRHSCASVQAVGIRDSCGHGGLTVDGKEDKDAASDLVQRLRGLARANQAHRELRLLERGNQVLGSTERGLGAEEMLLLSKSVRTVRHVTDGLVAHKAHISQLLQRGSDACCVIVERENQQDFRVLIEQGARASQVGFGSDEEEQEPIAPETVDFEKLQERLGDMHRLKAELQAGQENLKRAELFMEQITTKASVEQNSCGDCDKVGATKQEPCNWELANHDLLKPFFS